MRERLLYFRMIAFLFCVLGVYVMYFPHPFSSLLITNKMDNNLFIGKSKNNINDKISICPLNNITYIFLS
jgi:hypothetical protein